MSGRPSEFSQEAADAICVRLSGGESLRSICEGEEFPHKSTVFRWLEAHAEFRDQYARAREFQAESLADEILDISDDGHNDFMLRKHGETESWTENGEAMQRSRLRVDARKWLAGKLQPKKYGEKSAIEHTGANGGSIQVTSRIERVIVDPKETNGGIDDRDGSGIPAALATGSV